MTSILEKLGVTSQPAQSGHNGILGLFADPTATRMQIAGQILSNLSRGGKPMDTASELSNANYQGALTTKTNFDNANAVKMRDAASRYAAKIRKSNPEFADALDSDPTLIQKIWETKIARENDPNYIFQKTMLGNLAPPDPLGGGSLGAASPIAPLISGTPAAASVPPPSSLPPYPGGAAPTSRTIQGPPMPSTAAPAMQPAPVQQDPRIARLEQVSGIKGLTSDEAAALIAGMAGGATGFQTAMNQIRDERYQKSALEFSHQSTEAQQAAAKQTHEDALAAQEATRAQEAARLDETKKNNLANVASKLTDDFFKETNFHQSIVQVGQRTLESLKDPNLTPADQIRVMYDYVKSLDPNSAVREGEVGLARETQSYTDQLATMMDRISKGQIMQQSDVASMEKVILKLATQSEKRIYDITDKYKKRAKAMGVPEEYIFSSPPDESGFKTQFTEDKAPKPTDIHFDN